MKYIIFLLWVIFFHATFFFVNWLRNPSLSPVNSIPAAIILVMIFKPRLPLLKKYSFPEFSGKLEKFRNQIADLTLSRKKCSVCGLVGGISIIIETDINKNLRSKTKKNYCRSHGLQFVEKMLRNFKGKIILTEVEPLHVGSWTFYQPEDLKVHNYSEKDKKVLNNLIEEYRGKVKEGEVLWLDKTVIGDYTEIPLFKKLPEPEIITIDEGFKRLRRTFDRTQAKFKNSEFWFSEPRGEAGIYLWGEI